MSVRFGLVGTGYWAEKTHAAGLTAHEAVDFVGIWGRDPTRTRALAAKHGVRPFAEADDLFRCVDAVAFAVPPDVQADLAAHAAAAGCDLLLEKPTALSLEAAERLARAASSVRSVVFLTGRFAPPTQRWFDEVVLGNEWEGGSFRWIVPTAAPGGPYSGSAWRARHGALWDVVPHALSFLLPALGAVEEVAGVSGRGGAIALSLRHASRGVSSVSVDSGAVVRDTEIVFWGASGVARAPQRGQEHLPAAYAAAIDLLIQGGGPMLDAAFGAEVVRVIEWAEAAVRGGDPTSCGASLTPTFRTQARREPPS